MAIGRALQKYREKRAASEAASVAAREAGLKAPPEWDPAVAAEARKDLIELSSDEALEVNDARAQRIRHRKTGRIRRAKFLMAVDVLRMEGLKPKEIADTLGVSYQQVTGALHRLRTNADMPAQIKRIDDIAVPLAVDNVIVGVTNGSQFYTDRVMVGRGLYRSHKSIEKNDRPATLNLTIRVEYPDHMGPGTPLPQMRPGSIVGAPRLTDIEVPKALTAAPAPAAPAMAKIDGPVPAVVGIGTPDLR